MRWNKSLALLLGLGGVLFCVGASHAQAPPGGGTIKCGNPGVLCGTATNPLVTTPGGSGVDTANVTQFGSNPVVTGTGAAGVGIPRVTVSNDSSIIVSASALPTGAALDATLQSILTKLNASVAVTGNVGLVAGSALIGATETAARLDVTATVQNASYVSGNDIGGLVSFTLARTASGILQSVGIQFVGGATTQVNAVCFDSNPTGSTFTDKSTFTIAAVDQAKKINKGLFALTPAAQVGDAVTSAAVDNYAQPFNSTGTIFCAYVSTGTFTPATTTDMRVNIKYTQYAQ